MYLVAGGVAIVASLATALVLHFSGASPPTTGSRGDPATTATQVATGGSKGRARGGQLTPRDLRARLERASLRIIAETTLEANFGTVFSIEVGQEHGTVSLIRYPDVSSAVAAETAYNSNPKTRGAFREGVMFVMVSGFNNNKRIADSLR